MATDVYSTTSYLKIGNVHRYIIKYRLYDKDIQDIYRQGVKRDAELPETAPKTDLPQPQPNQETQTDLIQPQPNQETQPTSNTEHSFVAGAPEKIIVSITNVVPMSMRAAGVLSGPYTVYADLKKQKYSHKGTYFESSEIPQFETNLLPAQEVRFELTLNDFSAGELTWELNLVSQALFTTNCKVFYNLDIGYQFDSRIYEPESEGAIELLKQKLSVTELDTSDLWDGCLSLKSSFSKKKCHLVILTHGMMSNVTADMLYIAEQIKKKEENCIITGYTENVCKTERGVRYQGIKNGEFIIDQIKKIGVENIAKVSFVGHSLGGLVQTFSIAYCFKKYPEIMKAVVLENFISLASPLLGVLNDNPKYLQKLLTMGLVGKSGQDLGLTPLQDYNGQPFLFLLMCAHTRNCLRRFRNRTIYANCINDGIVPLYTSSLLFIDYNDVVENFQKLGTNVTVETSALESAETREKPIKEAINEKETKNMFSWNPLVKMSSLFSSQHVLSDISNSEDAIQPCDTNTSSTTQLPKLSILDTAQHVILHPIPSTKYLMNPESRSPTIVHDKLYSASDIKRIIASKEYKNLLKNEQNMTLTSKEMVLEEELAVKWHTDLSWRKVIVALEPDAHNSINVRRQFYNAYGWEVVDHMTEAHFGDKDFPRHHNHPEIPEEAPFFEEATDDVSDYDWLLTFEQASMIDGGVTGMIPTVSDLMEKWYNKLVVSVDERDCDTMKLQRVNGQKESSADAATIQLEEQELVCQYYATNM